MVDLISLVVFSVFSGVMLLAVLGFYIIVTRGRKAPHEADDYYSPKKKERSPVYNSRDDFFQRKQSENSGRFFATVDKRERSLTIAIVVFSIALFIIAYVFYYFEILLLLFMLPVIIRYIRSRRGARQNQPSAGDT